jgi:hypothetical protein
MSVFMISPADTDTGTSKGMATLTSTGTSTGMATVTGMATTAAA